MESAVKSQQLCNGILYCLLFYVFPQLPYHYPSGKVEKVCNMHPIVLVIKLAALGTSGHLDFVHLCSMVVTTVLELR